MAVAADDHPARGGNGRGEAVHAGTIVRSAVEEHGSGIAVEAVELGAVHEPHDGVRMSVGRGRDG